MRSKAARFSVTLGAALCLVIVSAGAVLAASAPAGTARPALNTSIDRAARVGRLPFSSNESTANAPSASNGADCVGSGHAVWFKYFSPVATALDVDTLGSDYDTTLSAWTGPPSSLTQLACNDDGNALGQQSEIQFDVPAAQSVYLMVASFESSPGGDLQLHVASLVNKPRRSRCGHPGQASAKNRCAGDTSYYVALGDSAAIYDGSRSYPDLINNSRVTRQVHNLKLVKLACSLETTDSFINSSFCGGSQLHKAMDFLSTNRGHVALVTIDIGGNDAAACANPATGVDWTCARRVLNTVLPTNMQTILAGLRQAAGPGPLMVGMNYYNPFLVYRLLGPAVYPLVDQTIFGQQLLNQTLEHLYATFGMPVANVQDAFYSTDLTTTVSSPWGRLPLAVERACSLLAVDCNSGEVRIIDTDPNVAGGAVIGRAFERTIRRLGPPA